MFNNFDNTLESILSPDIGKLILRFSVGVLILLHGIHKLFIGGVEGVRHLVVQSGFPEFFTYGIYIGEVIAPLLLILGIYARLSAFLISFTMAFAIFLAHSSQVFSLHSKTGGSLIELQLLFLFSALSITFIGGGKYSLKYQG